MDMDGDLMAKMTFKGLDEYIKQLNKLESNSDKYIGKAIYDGADIVADEIKSAINSLPTDNASYKKAGLRAGPSAIQKAGLVKSFGITKMRKDGTELNVKLGFDGYNNVKTKRWPNGQPNVMVARSIESGTSWMTKNAFVSKATRSSKNKAETKMGQTIDEEIKKLMD